MLREEDDVAVGGPELAVGFVRVARAAEPVGEDDDGCGAGEILGVDDEEGDGAFACGVGPGGFEFCGGSCGGGGVGGGEGEGLE